MTLMTEDVTTNKQTLAIEVSSFAYRYPKTNVDALQIKQWQVPAGERVFLRGVSGSGKSTLLQLLCGLRVGSGKLLIAGNEFSKQTQIERDRFRSRHIGMVFQQFNLIPYLSALDNVTLAANLAGLSHGAIARAEQLLAQVGLQKSTWTQTANTLSIGQQQRIAISRALINSPELLLLDEPTSALDGANQDLFMMTLMHHLDLNPNTTVIFVSHDERLESYFERSIHLTDISTNVLSTESGINSSTDSSIDSDTQPKMELLREEGGDH